MPLAAGLALSLHLSSPAPLRAPPAAAYGAVEPEGESYGWQTIFADFTSIGWMITAGLVVEWDAMGWAGAISLLVTPAILHFVHGNVGTGFMSLGLRLACVFLMVGGIVFPPVAFVGGIGMLFMIFVDAAWAVEDPAEELVVARF